MQCYLSKNPLIHATIWKNLKCILLKKKKTKTKLGPEGYTVGWCEEFLGCGNCNVLEWWIFNSMHLSKLTELYATKNGCIVY